MPRDAPGTLLDAEDWSFTLVLADPDTGAPRDLTGSAFKLTLRALADGSEVQTASTEAGDGSLTVLAPATAGKIAVSLPVKNRTWRAAIGAPLSLRRLQTIEGDLLRRPSASEPFAVEGAETIRFLVKPSTTQWPPSSP